MKKSLFFLETERCLFREMVPEDAPAIFLLNQPEEILKFTTDPPFESLEKAKQFLEAYNPYSKYGMGRWAVILKETGEFTGWCGLKYIPEEGEVDLGYRFLKHLWGQGLGTETANVMLNYGHKELGIDRIVGRVHPENFRSKRILEKIGMKYECDLIYNGASWMNFTSFKGKSQPITKPTCWPFPAPMGDNK